MIKLLRKEKRPQVSREARTEEEYDMHIPFYLMVFSVGVLMVMAMVVPALVFVSPFITFMLYLVDLLFTITSSMYGASALVKAVRQGKVSKKYAVVHGILHFLFVTDVISAVCVFVKMSKHRNKSLK